MAWGVSGHPSWGRRKCDKRASGCRFQGELEMDRKSAAQTISSFEVFLYSTCPS